MSLKCQQCISHLHSIQSIFVENGIALSKEQKNELFNYRGDAELIESFNLTVASQRCIEISLEVMKHLVVQKETLKRMIIEMGVLFQKEIRLCIGIKGVTPFLVLAFLADVGDITRFKNVRGFNAYLGVVPTVKSSGGKTQMGHITRQSRKLARTLFTQPLSHMINSSDSFVDFYNGVKLRRGVGRSRIAVIRKVFTIMRRMILTGEAYRGIDEKNYQKDINDFEIIISKAA